MPGIGARAGEDDAFATGAKSGSVDSGRRDGFAAVIEDD